MRLFNPPKSNYESYYLEGAFDLTWRYNAVMTLFFFTLILAGSILNKELFLAGLICWSIPVLSLWVLKLTRKYEIIAYIHIILGSTATGFFLNFEPANNYNIEAIFMMLTVFYAFITLRRKIGMIVLGIQLLWFVIYVFSKQEKTIEYTFNEKIAQTLILAMAMAMFSFLIIEFLKLRKRAEKKYVLINKDLTEVNQVVNAQNHEKTVMLKEIHHRVKNNLQVISSLLRLQSYEIEEEASRVHFQDAINRVSAMALIHEKMYQNENLSQINLESYIHTLATDLIRTHATNIEIQLYVNSDIQELGNDTLVPVALILNELITNSLKHAFDDELKGKIDIEFRKMDRENYFSFVYKDGGEWKTTEKGASFGLELISTLTEQLDGKVERNYDNGTKYKFILRDLK